MASKSALDRMEHGTGQRDEDQDMFDGSHSSGETKCKMQNANRNDDVLVCILHFESCITAKAVQSAAEGL